MGRGRGILQGFALHPAVSDLLHKSMVDDLSSDHINPLSGKVWRGIALPVFPLVYYENQYTGAIWMKEGVGVLFSWSGPFL
jgi:hypothetical protein